MHPTNIMIPAWINGTLTPVEKLAAHQQGLKHLAVSVFVVRDGAILIQQRALGKYHTPGLWANTCCTHPAWNEDPQACGNRRLDEELGITGLDLHHRGQIEYRADVGNDLIEHEVVEVFLAKAPADLAMEPNPEEVMAVRWVSLETLKAEVEETPALFTPWLRIYLDKHAEMILNET